MGWIQLFLFLFFRSQPLGTTAKKKDKKIPTIVRRSGVGGGKGKGKGKGGGTSEKKCVFFFFLIARFWLHFQAKKNKKY